MASERSNCFEGQRCREGHSLLVVVLAGEREGVVREYNSVTQTTSLVQILSRVVERRHSSGSVGWLFSSSSSELTDSFSAISSL
jgi:hypothetical protein